MDFFSGSLPWYLFSLVQPLLLLGDLLLAAGAGWHGISLCLSWYCTQLLNPAEGKVVAAGSAVMLVSFVLYGALFVPLVYLVPTYVCGYYLRFWLRHPTAHLGLMLMVATLIQLSVAHYYLFDRFAAFEQICQQLCANFIFGYILLYSNGRYLR